MVARRANSRTAAVAKPSRSSSIATEPVEFSRPSFFWSHAAAGPPDSAAVLGCSSAALYRIADLQSAGRRVLVKAQGVRTFCRVQLGDTAQRGGAATKDRGCVRRAARGA